MIAAALIAMQSLAVPQKIPEAESYMSCVIGEAQRLLPSGEAAEAIARAAVFLCKPKLGPAVRAVDRASNAELKSRGWPVTIPGQIRTTDNLEAMMKAKSEDAALVIVIEARLRASVR